MTLIDYTCNVCAAANRSPVEELSRENPSCMSCRSTVRMREVAYLASLALFGAALPIPELPVRPHLRGVGLSDWWEYADRLAHHIDYRNTWYHEEPRLDITDVPDGDAGTYDLVIATDVFEHVLPPVQRAFDGAARLLKPGGAFVFTVPWVPEGTTVEHYPDAVDYEVIELEDCFEVDIVTADGSRRRETAPCFHGGPGSTLEMRLFSLPDIKKHLAAAGFNSLRVLREDVREFGIVHPSPHSLPLLARR
jgi:SAM-dependent methyltransferase